MLWVLLSWIMKEKIVSVDKQLRSYSYHYTCTLKKNHTPQPTYSIYSRSSAVRCMTAILGGHTLTFFKSYLGNDNCGFLVYKLKHDPAIRELPVSSYTLPYTFCLLLSETRQKASLEPYLWLVLVRERAVLT